MTPSTSAIVTTYNRRDRLREVITPLLDDPATLEVVVVVDHCHDGSMELLEQLARTDDRVVPVWAERNLGQPRARALGVERARGEVVLSLDDDVVAAPGLVTGHAARHAERPGLVVLGYMPTEEPAPRPPHRFATYEYAAQYETRCREYEADSAVVLGHLWGGNFSVAREAFLAAVADYDFPLRYHEDRELGLLLAKQGLTGVFDRSLRATHRHERPFDGYVRDARNAGRSAWALHARHADLLGPIDPDEVVEHYSLPARVLVRASDRPRLERAAVASLKAATAAAGRAHAWSLESKLPVIARHINERQGMRAAAREGFGTA